jgi:hypothetical protein
MSVCVPYICCECMLCCAFCRSLFDFRLKVFEVSCQEGMTERRVLNSRCTEDALLNSEESDKDVLRHRTGIINSGEEYL